MILPPRFILVALGSACLLAASSYCQELDVLKKTTERWIDVRGRLSKEQSDWLVEREMLKATVDTLAATRDSVRENVEILELESKKLNEQMTEATERVASFEETNTIILDHIKGYEARMKELARWLPSPLLEEIDPLLRKIPGASDTTTPAPNRLQNVVAIATLVDEFNNDLTLTHTIKTLENGDVIDVRVLYWGLATGYATNLTGTNAWVLTPAPDEWEWKPAKENAVAIGQLFDVYDKTIDPVAVEIPFAFAGKETAQ